MEPTTKKKLGTAGAGVAAVGAAVALTAGTFSFFTDSHSDDVKGSTGNLSIERSYGGQTDFGNMAPGDTKEATYTLKNTGSVDGDLTVSLKDQGGNDDLKDAIEVSVDGEGSGTLSEIEGHEVSFGTLDPDESKTFEIKTEFVDNGKDQSDLEDQDVELGINAELRHGA